MKNASLRNFAFAALCAFAGTMLATPPVAEIPGAALAPTPPMGWNSWDSYGPAIREDEVKANVDAMASRLKSSGWQYIVVDIEWYQPDAHAHGYIARGRVDMDANGRFVPSPTRFPSAANGAGFKALADYAHSKGLKFGIHIMRGIPREAVDQNLPIEGTSFHAADVADKVNVCRWKGMEDTYGVDMSKPGAQAYYDSIARLYARWGVDYVKADDMSRPFRGPEIEALHTALSKSGRPIVLSLSPGPAPVDQYEVLKANAQLWRISNDFWDRWQDVKAQFRLMKNWQGKVQAGGFPDADMLPLGHIGIRAERGVDRNSLLTHDEQITLMSQWSIFRSPLMMGGDLPTSDDFTFSMLTNNEILAVNQHSSNGHQSYESGTLVAWTADIPDGKGKYVSMTNLGDSEANVNVPWKDLDVSYARPAVRDLWAHKDGGRVESVQVTLRPHATMLWKVSQ